MFTQEQRLEIAKLGAKECGFDVEVFNVETTNPLGMFREIATKIARPVLIVGPDRKTQFEKMFLTYGNHNAFITDPNEKNFGKGEVLCVNNRGDNETSGSKVRMALQQKNEYEFLKLTGYNKLMYHFLIDIIKRNNELRHNIQ